MPPASPPTSPARWHLRLLGNLVLEDAHRRITHLPSRAASALLARLALWPERAHAREELIELLWPGVALDVGRNRLRQTLSSLKSVLEPEHVHPPQPVLLADRVHVRVVSGSLSCDATQFTALARQRQAQMARALYGGELLPGFYEDWVDEERLRLAALFDGLPSPTHAPAVQAPAITAAATVVPTRIAPSAQARVTLPSYLTRMFGADEQALQLRNLVLTQRLVTLVGPGGSGKTRLAVEMAHSLRERAAWPLPASASFDAFDVLAFVSLLDCTSAAQTLDALTGALHLTPGAEPPLRALVSALSGRRVLLVLDNCEQLDGTAVACIAELVTSLPGLHALATSRRALGVDGEHEFALAALALPEAEATLDEAAANASITLFVARAQAVRADFRLNPRNVATLVALVRELEGMPLALELAASRVRSVAPAQMLARLRSSGTPQLDLLTRQGKRAGLDARHASMLRVIAWSWQRLDVPQQQLLTALTVFVGGFNTASALALASDTLSDVASLLDELVANSMLQSHAGPDDELRFGVYQPIREFAASQLDETTALQWRARQRAWAVAWARALPLTPTLDAVRAELGNLAQALASAVADHAPEDAIELLLALRRCLEDVELPAAGLQHAHAAVQMCQDAVRKALGQSLLGPLLFAAGQGDAAEVCLEAALACTALSPTQRARALQACARVRWRRRRRADEVEPLLGQAQVLVDLQSNAPADVELASSLYALRAFVSNVHHHRLAEGERLHSLALAGWEKLGNQHAINSGRYNLAVCAQNAARNEEALRRLMPIVASARAQHDWRRLSQSLNVQGNAHAGLRQWPLAVLDYQECLRTAWQTMAPYDLAFGFWNLPRALAHLRQPERALRLMAFAVSFWRERFGELSLGDKHDVRRLRRLARCQLSAEQVQQFWREGEQLTLEQALALALG